MKGAPEKELRWGLGISSDVPWTGDKPTAKDPKEPRSQKIRKGQVRRTVIAGRRKAGEKHREIPGNCPQGGGTKGRKSGGNRPCQGLPKRRGSKGGGGGESALERRKRRRMSMVKTGKGNRCLLKIEGEVNKGTVNSVGRRMGIRRNRRRGRNH